MKYIVQIHHKSEGALQILIILCIVMAEDGGMVSVFTISHLVSFNHPNQTHILSSGMYNSDVGFNYVHYQKSIYSTFITQFQCI